MEGLSEIIGPEKHRFVRTQSCNSPSSPTLRMMLRAHLKSHQPGAPLVTSQLSLASVATSVLGA